MKPSKTESENFSPPQKGPAIYVCRPCRMLGPLTDAQVKAHEIVRGHTVERVDPAKVEQALKDESS